MMNHENKIIHILTECIAPVILVIVCILGYGILIPSLGFYWDDWPSVWFNHIGGPSIFPDAFASDRPLLGRLFMITMSVMGESILRWQVFALVMRCLAALAFWGLLRLAWPAKPRQALWAALLFAIYPAFIQQWIAVTYSHVFLIYTTFLVSLILMLVGMQKKGWRIPAAVLAYILTGLSAFTAEYFIGLEIIRPLLIWLTLIQIEGITKGSFSKRLWQTLKIWAPYVAILAVYLFWRIFIQGFPRSQIQAPIGTNAPPSNILDTITSSLSVIVQDCLEVLAGIWGMVFHPSAWLSFSAPVITSGVWMIAILAGMILTLIFIIIKYKGEQSSEKEDKSWIVLGFLALLGGGLPFWAINLSYKAEFPYDRSALPMMFGASLILAGAIDLMTKGLKARSVLFSILIAGAICYQYNTAATYAKENEDQRAFLWQLSWRVPAIQPGTVLVTDGWPFKYNTDNSLTAPLNWIYNSEPGSRELKYAFMDVSARLGNSLPGIKDETTGRLLIDINSPITIDYRAARFSGNTNRMIAFIHHPPACLHILDPKIDGVRYTFPETTFDLVPLSRPDLIVSDKKAARPPLAQFGKEQKKDWCIFYEEADLSRQQRNWDNIVDIGKIAFDEHHIQPSDPGEYLPFIEGYARTDHVARARILSQNAYTRQRALQPALCLLWQDLEASLGPSEVQPALTALGCRKND